MNELRAILPLKQQRPDLPFLFPLAFGMLLHGFQRLLFS
jgi:hypothetical protein